MNNFHEGDLVLINAKEGETIYGIPDLNSLEAFNDITFLNNSNVYLVLEVQVPSSSKFCSHALKILDPDTSRTLWVLSKMMIKI